MSLYPQIDAATGAFVNPSPAAAAAAAAAAARPSPFLAPAASAPAAATSLRVVIAEQFRVAPPVRLPPEAAAVPAARDGVGSGGFDFEHRALEALAAPPPAAAPAAGEGRIEAAISAAAARAGADRAAAALGLAVALAAVAGGREPGAAALDAATRGVVQLRELGYGDAVVVGALVAAGGDVQRAAEGLP
jgi:hypothetical protein